MMITHVKKLDVSTIIDIIMNNKIRVNLADKSYDILIGEGQIASLQQFLAQKNYSKIFIITDENVAKLHLPRLRANMNGVQNFVFEITAGEKSKDFATLETLSEAILQNNIDRNSLIIAFGGGVVGDLAGFLASIILRGVDFVQIPTTLLAAVDSSVGGKTAINSRAGKNLIGSFYQPKLVICDLDFLQTLPDREFRAGYAEALKYGLIEDKEFFNFLDKNLDKIFARDKDLLRQIIAKSCQSKADIVSQDEKENGVRALLNFGHTFGHVFEIETGYSNKLLHGEAVGIGMLMAAKMSTKLDMLDASQYEIIKNHITRAGLNIDLQALSENWNIDVLVQHLYKDKKTENGALTFILLEEIGKAVIKKSVAVDEFRKVVAEFV